jgi:hypothetical protein
MGNLGIHYSENMTGVATRNISPSAERHGLICIKVPNESFQNHAPQIFEEYFGPSGKGLNRSLRAFAKFVEPFDYPKSILDHVQAEISDPDYTRACIRGILFSVAPEYRQPTPLIFDVLVEPDSNLRIESNVDFDAANASYHIRVSPKHSVLSNAYLLARLLSSRGTLELASGLSSDLLFGPMGQVIAANKLESLLRSQGERQAKFDGFTDFLVDDTRAISQAVNARQRNFEDVLKLVVQAQKFKEWLRKQDESSDLCAEYCREVSRLDWADKLPHKTARWFLINAAALALGIPTSPVVGTLVGLGISAADAFLLERVLKGWRPSQFVEGPLKDFIRKG